MDIKGQEEGSSRTKFSFTPAETEVLRAVFRERVTIAAARLNLSMLTDFDYDMANFRDNSGVEIAASDITTVVRQIKEFADSTTDSLSDIALSASGIPAFANPWVAMRVDFGKRAGVLVEEIAEKTAAYEASSSPDFMQP